VVIKQSRNVCAPCARDLPWLALGCRICAIPLIGEAKTANICGQCAQNKPAYFCVKALFEYKPPVDSFITALKFQQQLLYANFFGAMLGDHLRQEYQGHVLPELVIPIPLHAQRLRARGFNQALEIARPIAKKLSLPINFNDCKRIRQTAAQSLLPAAERLANVERAFVVKRPFAAKYVAIVDDVITTGHTIAEFSRCLKQAGVERIDVWSVARTNH
jgi:ComF family protein